MVTRALTNSALVRRRIELTCGDTQRAFEELWSHPDLATLFPAFLILLQQITRASVPLMEEALREASRLAESDPVAAELAEYLDKHIDEERDHDVWTLNDLEAIGYPRDRVLGITPLPSVASLVGSQYYWLHHHHPVALMGYIALLEGSPPSAAHIARLRAATQLPEEAFRTYDYHGRIDPHHTEDLNRFLDGMPLKKSHLGLIGVSAAHTGAALADCVRSLDLIALSAAEIHERP